MSFEIGDHVRVVSALSPFWGWTGEVIYRHDGDLMFGEKQYRVEFRIMTVDRTFIIMPLLFREVELAHSL